MGSGLRIAILLCLSEHLEHRAKLYDSSGGAGEAYSVSTLDGAGRVRGTASKNSNRGQACDLRFCYVYPNTSNIVQSFTTVQDSAGEAYSVSTLDGAGRVRV